MCLTPQRKVGLGTSIQYGSNPCSPIPCLNPFLKKTLPVSLMIRRLWHRTLRLIHFKIKTLPPEWGWGVVGPSAFQTQGAELKNMDTPPSSFEAGVGVHGAKEPEPRLRGRMGEPYLGRRDPLSQAH